MNVVDRFTSWAPRILGILRIFVGIFFIGYGARKLFGVLGGMPPGVPKFIIYGAGSLELIGGTLILLGLFSRITAFTLSGLMACAYFIGHAPKGFWPAINGGEDAILYCWLFLYFAAQGPGAFALDNLRRRPGTP
ncbi:MAG: DoxX family protein [Acidobacteria bacterium]|nr:DoxX family protein [Acidobacteriota bacterium]